VFLSALIWSFFWGASLGKDEALFFCCFYWGVLFFFGFFFFWGGRGRGGGGALSCSFFFNFLLQFFFFSFLGSEGLGGGGGGGVGGNFLFVWARLWGFFCQGPRGGQSWGGGSWWGDFFFLLVLGVLLRGGGLFFWAGLGGKKKFLGRFFLVFQTLVGVFFGSFRGGGVFRGFGKSSFFLLFSHGGGVFPFGLSLGGVKKKSLWTF